ncbi:hypothetical protein [Aquisphaera insulae]|uniref:hypothetical protein n=1 Tax=Aquisphaera insulae TaxID=2712864 RepID=UPI0013EA2526|nr:hypothetical protein [Aquisphaera insulae]
MSKTLVAFGLVAFLAVPAMAQPPGGGRGFGFGGPGGGGLGMLLSNKSVQEELKLAGDQVEKVKELADKTREKIEKATEGLEGQERFAKVREISKELEDDAKAAIKDVLKPEQITRLHQIRNQTLGYLAFANEEVAKKLELTDAQKDEVKSISEEAGSKMREIFQESQGDRQAARTKINELRKETLAKVEAKLTDAQKATWKELTGAPFELKMEGRPGGPGR